MNMVTQSDGDISGGTLFSGPTKSDHSHPVLMYCGDHPHISSSKVQQYGFVGSSVVDEV